MTRIETAIIMATDLVGSTEIASRIGNARFEELRREHDSILGDDIEDAGGRVVKNTGDGLLAAFPSVTAALSAAVAIQQHLERRGRSADVKISVRIGVSIGDALVDEGDYFGIPPIEATRLCGAAGGGEILIADPVRATLHDRRGHRFEARGALALKGLADPVLAWRVGWDPLAESTGTNLPARLRALPQATYIGRAREQSLLLERWDLAVDGQRQVVLISGEPGIGKTRLVTQAASAAIHDEATILYGRCDEDQGIPYHPWLEILRDYVRIAPRRLLRPHAGELRRLVPELSQRLGAAGPPPLADPDAERYLLFKAVAGLLAAAAAHAPLLVILDDLHWADEPTLALIKHVVRASSTDRLLVLGTFRDSDVGPEDLLSGILADLRREPAVTRLELTGLEQADIVDMIETLAGHPIGAAGQGFAGRVHRDTAGNPFFVGELLRHLRETDAIVVDRVGRWSFTDPDPADALPRSVREVIGRRLQRLGGDAREVLSAGAVLGPEFDVQLLAQATGRPAPEVVDLLAEGVQAALLTRTAPAPAPGPRPRATGVYAFSHGLVQATLYDALPAGRRVGLHRDIGLAIEQSVAGRADRLAELAHHFLEAALGGDVDRAVDYATQAGHQAMRQFAYEQAETLFARALAVAPADRPTTRIGLLQCLGEAQMRRGETTAARRTLLEAAASARRHDEPEALARATLACGIWGLTAGVDEVLVELAEEAIARLEGGPSRRLLAEVKGLLAATLYFASAPRRERGLRLSAEAVVLAQAEHERAPDRASAATLAYVRVRAMLAQWGTDSAGGDVECGELLALCREVGNGELELLVRNWRVNVLLELGDFPGFDRELARVEHMAAELRQPRAIAFLPLHRGMRAIMQGRFAEAEGFNARARELGARVQNSVSELAADAQMLLTRMLQGRLPELEQPLRGLVATYPEVAALRCALVVALVQAGRDDEARAELAVVTAAGLDAIPRDNTYVIGLALLAEAAAELADAATARGLYERLKPLMGRWVVSPTAAALWPLDRTLGILAAADGAFDLALAHLAAARAVAELVDALPTLALTALDEARVLAARRAPEDRERAVARAREARLLAEHLQMHHVVSAAARLEAGSTDKRTAA
jgi:class 3 adenylate cyclase